MDPPRSIHTNKHNLQTQHSTHPAWASSSEPVHTQAQPNQQVQLPQRKLVLLGASPTRLGLLLQHLDRHAQFAPRIVCSTMHHPPGLGFFFSTLTVTSLPLFQFTPEAAK